MTSPLAAVLEIAGVGSVLLFLALAGLIGLMYALTAARLPGTDASAAGDAGDDAEASTAAAAQAQAAAEAEAEQERRWRAVVLAVAVARARLTAQAARRADHTPPAWRNIHRGRRLSTPAARARRRA